MVTFAIAIGGVAFGIYHFFRNPDIKNNTAIKLLQEQLKGERELSKQAISTNQNHMHTLTNEVNNLKKTVNDTGIQLAKLATIIDERIPKKNI